MFLPRHGVGHTIAPHEVNYRANIAALVELGITGAIATNAVGSLRLDLPPGSLVLLDDFIDFTRARPLTYFDSGARHTDFTNPYCPTLRHCLMESAAREDIELLQRGTYVCVDGPRYESPAEVQLFAQWGADVVGMTGLPEAVFAREAGLCYAAVAIVTNCAAGLQEQELKHEDVVEKMRLLMGSVSKLIINAAVTCPDDRDCSCGRSR